MGTCRWLRAFATSFDSCSSSMERSAIEHVHPVRVVHGSRASCPARLLGEYINPIRRNIQCQSTSAFHLGRGWKRGERDAGLNPWQLARERGCEAEGGRRRTQRGLSIYATVRWTLLLLTISCCCGKVDREGCVREGGERGRGRERKKSDRARAAHGLKRTRHVFVTYYIFIATNEPLNARTRREGGTRRGEAGRKQRRRRRGSSAYTANA